MDGDARRRNPSHYGLGTRRRNYRTGDLVSSLEKGEPLEIVPPISRSLATRIPRIVDVLLALFSQFSSRRCVRALRRGIRNPKRELGCHSFLRRRRFVLYLAQRSFFPYGYRVSSNASVIHARARATTG